jgi:hypothetical protein
MQACVGRRLASCSLAEFPFRAPVRLNRNRLVSCSGDCGADPAAELGALPSFGLATRQPVMLQRFGRSDGDSDVGGTLRPVFPLRVEARLSD